MDLLIRCERLFDGLSDTAVPHAFVAVTDDRIAAVGPQSQLGDRPDERFARIIDLDPDCTLLPGLINMHVHMACSAAPEFVHHALTDSVELRTLRAAANLHTTLMSGTTTVRDCGTDTVLAMTARRAVEDGVIEGPRIVTCGLGITSAGGHFWYASREADTLAEAIRAVHETVAAGADFVKVFATAGRYLVPGSDVCTPQYSEAELRAIVVEARQMGRDVAVHAHATGGIRHAVAAGVHSIEHCTFLTPTGVACDMDLVRQIADAGIYVSPTIFRGPGKHGGADRPNRNEPAPFDEYSPKWFESLRRMGEAGVRIVSGNDVGSPHIGFDDYPGDLAYLGEGTGWSPVRVLKSATSLAAEALRRDDLGAVTPGRRADLLAVRGDPLRDLWCLENTELVVAAGRVAVESGSRGRPGAPGRHPSPHPLRPPAAG